MLLTTPVNRNKKNDRLFIPILYGEVNYRPIDVHLSAKLLYKLVLYVHHSLTNQKLTHSPLHVFVFVIYSFINYFCEIEYLGTILVLCEQILSVTYFWTYSSMHAGIALNVITFSMLLPAEVLPVHYIGYILLYCIQEVTKYIKWYKTSWTGCIQKNRLVQFNIVNIYKYTMHIGPRLFGSY